MRRIVLTVAGEVFDDLCAGRRSFLVTSDAHESLSVGLRVVVQDADGSRGGAVRIRYILRADGDAAEMLTPGHCVVEVGALSEEDEETFRREWYAS